METGTIRDSGRLVGSEIADRGEWSERFHDGPGDVADPREVSKRWPARHHRWAVVGPVLEVRFSTSPTDEEYVGQRVWNLATAADCPSCRPGTWELARAGDGFAGGAGGRGTGGGGSREPASRGGTGVAGRTVGSTGWGRYVHGPVNAVCKTRPIGHDAPFGDWGVGPDRAVPGTA